MQFYIIFSSLISGKFIPDVVLTRSVDNNPSKNLLCCSSQSLIGRERTLLPIQQKWFAVSIVLSNKTIVFIINFVLYVNWTMMVSQVQFNCWFQRRWFTLHFKILFVKIIDCHLLISNTKNHCNKTYSSWEIDTINFNANKNLATDLWA
jgi:hypothetical protein